LSPAVIYICTNEEAVVARVRDYRATTNVVAELKELHIPFS
jgi:hypothetical protein